jgi:hypothetical protein
MIFPRSNSRVITLLFCSAAVAVAISSRPSPAQSPTVRPTFKEPNPPEQQLRLKELPRWLTLHMELRSRTEEQSALGYVSGKDRLYDLTRVRGSFDISASPFMDVYAQFHDLHALGLPLRDVASNMRDTFDLRQGYINLHYKNQAQLFTGRQLLIFGDERVVGISDWSNTSRSWDGFDLRLNYSQFRADVFSTSVVAIHPTSLNTHGAGLSFHGIQTDFLKLLPHTSILPFVFFRTYPHVRSRQGVVGSETEATFGTEWNAKIPGGFETSGLVDLQRGSFSNDSIHAGAAILRGGYTFQAPVKFRAVAEYDYSSGNSPRNPFRVSTYDQQYPGNHNAFGLVDLFGFQNIKQNRLNLYITAHKNWDLLFQGESLHITSLYDGVYDAAAHPILTAPSGGFRHDGIGTGFDASLTHHFTRGLEFDLGMGHFSPGYVMTSRSRGAPLTLAYAQLVYRFRVDHE